jgi:2-oxo-4-hydroxy-4-carboxy-5-ureidoimidazoline decarboxylase
MNHPHTLAELNAADRESFTSALGHLFEHSPWVAAEAWPARPFRDASDLHAKLCAAMRAGSREQHAALIRAHPDLAGRLARLGQLTAESTREQAGAGLDALTPEERATFEKLNRTYRGRFRFPFIICARLSSKAEIVAAMQLRINNPPEIEFQTALAEIEKIAELRLKDFLARESHG